MSKYELKGKRFGRLVAIKETHSTHKGTYWLCQCDCGNEKTIVATNLVAHTRSCGCLTKESVTKRNTSHGLTKIPEYYIWVTMKMRCYNPKSEAFKNYGGRGIKICKRWYNSFVLFYKDMGKRPSNKYSIERKNVNGDYKPSNCKWATMKEQGANKTNSVYIIHNGEKKILQDWAIELSTDHSCISFYLKKGKTFSWIYDYYMNKKTKIA